MSTFLNLSSIILGVVGVLIPIVIIKRKKLSLNSLYLTWVSFTASTLSIVLQVFEVRHRVAIGDVSAVMDTINAIAMVSVLLLICTSVVNLVVIFLVTKRKID